MNKRLTRHVDEFPCRIEECTAGEWIEKISGTNAFCWDTSECVGCPFEKYINKLAEYEDKEEMMEDDLK